MSLKQIAETYGCSQKKGDVDHNKIFLDNWDEQYDLQNMDEYITGDVEILAEAYTIYNNIIMQKYQFELLGQNNIMTASSLAKNVFWNNYYSNPSKNTPRVYQVPDEFQANVFKSYKGGSCQVFIHGHHTN